MREQGQTLAVAAVLMVLLMALLGLVADGGNLYLQRRRMQNAADAAALAGACKLRSFGSVSTVEETAIDYAKRDGATNCEVSVDGQTVNVRVSRDVETYFVGIVGINNFTVRAEASAKVEDITVTETATPTIDTAPTPLYTPTPIPTPRVRLTK